MNGIDLSTASDIRLGGTTVSAVYLGSTLIWPTTHNYANDYFTIESLEDSNSFRFVRETYTSQTTTNATIYYSLDNGVSWTTYEVTDNSTTYITINTGKTISLKSNLTKLGFYIESTKTFNAYGNLHSLLFLDDFATMNALPSNFIMTGLFSQSNIVSAENLILPCTNLSGRNSCYYGMFLRCTSLTTPPELPATTLSNSCYVDMFSGCTSLTTAPELPATVLTEYCYNSMFSGCTSLTTAPELPATVLVRGCYDTMFFGCSSLNNITCLGTNVKWNDYDCTIDWVNGVASSGTFTKAAAMTDWTTGNSGIPSGWTVQDA